MLAQLKSLDVDRLALDEAIGLAAYAKMVSAEYDARGVSHPEWLDDAIRTLNTDITARTRDALEMRLKEITAQRTQLMSADEKRAKLDAEEAALREKLAAR